jgi:hypothetical protein
MIQPIGERRYRPSSRLSMRLRLLARGCANGDGDLADVALVLRELGLRTFTDQRTAAEHEQPVAGLADLGQDVARDQDRVVLLEIVDQVAHLDDLHGVEASRGFVEDQELRVVDDRLGEADALTKAVRQRIDRIVRDLVQRRDVEDLAEPALQVHTGHAAELARELEIVHDRHLGVERGVLRQEADALADLVRRGDGVDAADFDRAGARSKIGREDAKGGRLAGTVQAEKADGFAVSDLERDRSQGAFTAVELREFGCSNHWLGP